MPFFLVTALFFLWGVPSNLNDVLIRQFMKSFAISRFQAGLVQSAFYMGYFLLATPAALIDAQARLQIRHHRGTAPFRQRSFPLLAGRCYRAIRLLPLRALRHCQRPFLSGDRLQSFYCAVGRARERGPAPEFLSGLQSVGLDRAVYFMGTVFIFSGIELTPQQVLAMQAANTYDAYLEHETMRVVDALHGGWADRFGVGRPDRTNPISYNRPGARERRGGSWQLQASCCVIPAFSSPSWRSFFTSAPRSVAGATSFSTCRTEPMSRRRLPGIFLPARWLPLAWAGSAPLP